MRKLELIKEISKKTEIEKPHVERVVETLMTVIQDHISDGNTIYLRGFGTFNIIKRKAKTGRNFHSKAEVIIPARNVPHFKPVKSFVRKVQKSAK
jgi:DNA-binding protein HU-beta